MPHVQNVCLMFGAVESDERLSNFLQKQNGVKCNIFELNKWESSFLAHLLLY